MFVFTYFLRIGYFIVLSIEAQSKKSQSEMSNHRITVMLHFVVKAACPRMIQQL